MSLNIGDLYGTLTLRSPQWDSKLRGLPGEVGQAGGAATREATKQGGLIGSGLGRAFTGAVSTAFGVASTVVGASLSFLAAKTLASGVEFNVLEQTSRAALTTILGGTQAANEQMDKLDAFVRNSPFAKGVFIQAQQQLLSFGVQADKVVPTLQAINDAVAAMGGSDTDIQEVSDTLAEMVSQGKISAVTFDQLGAHGIDAATLIGQQLGKTSQEVRDMVTGGALDVNTAFDAIVKGMEARFGGAAQNIKQQWVGTQDSIKAAIRDLGGELVSPFIDPNGGGYAIRWGNDLAAIIRSSETNLKPLIDDFQDKLDPALQDVTGWLDRAAAAVARFTPDDFESFLREVQQYLPSLAGAGGAIGAMSLGFLRGIPILGEFIPKINPVLAAIVGIATSTPEGRDALKQLLKAIQPLVPFVVQLSKAFADGLNAVLPTAAGLLGGVATAATPLIKVLTSMPTWVYGTVGAFIALQAVRGGLSSFFATASTRMLDMAVNASPKLQGALLNVAGGFERVAGFLTGPWGLAVGIGAAIIGGAIIDNIAKTQAQIDTFTNSLEKNTGALTDNTRAEAVKELHDSGAIKIANQLGVPLDTLTDAALGNTKAMQELKDAQDKAGDSAVKAGQNYGNFGSAVRDGTPKEKDMSKWNDLVGAVGGVSDKLDSARTRSREWLESSDAASKQASAFSDNLGKLNDSISTNGASADTSSAAYKANKAALDDLGKSANDYITTVQNQTGSTAQAKQATQEMAVNLYNAAVQMGMSSGAAAEYTGKILGIPTSQVTQFWNNAGDATWLAERYRDTILAIPTSVVTVLSQVDAGREQAQHRAYGGLLRGPGTGTSDSIPLWASNGEYIVRASAAQRNLSLLNAINSGYTPRLSAMAPRGYATGGEVRVSTAAPGITPAYQTIDARVVVQGNVGWDPTRLAAEADRRRRQKIALTGVQNISVP